MGGIFVQDDYQVSPTLTVNLGLRWSYLGSMSDKQKPIRLYSRCGFGDAHRRQPGSDRRSIDQPEGQLRAAARLCMESQLLPQQCGISRRFGINYEENQIAILRSGDANVPNAISFGPRRGSVHRFRTTPPEHQLSVRVSGQY